MSLFDIILIIILVGFIFRGFSRGLIMMVGTFLGTIAGAFFASHFYLNLFELVKGWFGGFDNLGKIACFIFLFIAVNFIVIIIFKIIDKTYDLLSIIPFLGAINRIGGAALGFLVGVLIIGLVIYVIAKYANINSGVGSWLIESKIAPTLLLITKMLMPILSFSFKSLKSII